MTKIYLEFTLEQYRLMRAIIAKNVCNSVCDVCREEYGTTVVRLIDGNPVHSWSGPTSNPLLDEVIKDGDVQLSIWESVE